MNTSIKNGAPDWSLRLIADLDASDHRAKELLERLNLEQLNSPPAPGAWSGGQCLDHMAVANELYLVAMSKSLIDEPACMVAEITPGWFSRWFIHNYVEPSPQTKRVPAPKKIVPGKQVDTSVLDRFLRSNDAAREVIGRAGSCDVNRIRFRNPLIPIIRFTVGTGLQIVVAHERRHLQQAERAKKSLNVQN